MKGLMFCEKYRNFVAFILSKCNFILLFGYFFI